jgi:hypothetical protein
MAAAMASLTARLPNFFLAGVPKAGTTSLYFYLRQHPQVYMSPIKEPTFFGAADVLSAPLRDHVLPRVERDRTALRSYLDGPQLPGAMFWVLEWEDYLELFRGVRDEAAIGEGSVSYFWLPSAAGAIRTRLPDARLLFVLRDPAERLYARYLGMSAHSGGTFRERFRAALDPGDAWAPEVGVGCYGTHLQRFLHAFPQDQIRAYLYEDYCSDARALLRDVFGFLGVDPGHPIDLSRRRNQTFVPRFPRLHAIRRRLLKNSPAVPWLPEGARRALKRLYRRPRPQGAMDPDDRRMVIDYYRDEILRTADLIGRDLSAWLR